jgi:4-amino-4-deoxy-L-arabinose transferase-like glycosyltransferase
MQNHRRFLVLLALFALGVLIQQSALPVLEGNDEEFHYNYLVWLRSQDRLPDRLTFRTNGINQMSGQPPLTYWLTGTLFDLINLPDSGPKVDVSTIHNPWGAPLTRWRRTDNLTLYMHGPDEQLFGHPEAVIGIRVARLISLLYALIAVIGAYGASREFFRGKHEAWALTATAVFAFTPLMVYIGAYVSNDVSGIAFATLVIWQTLRILRLGATPQRLVIAGVLLGLGALSKVNTLLVAPGVGLALLFDWRNHHRSFGRLVLNGLLLGIPILLIFGPWVLYGLTTYNDPFGFSPYAVLRPAIAPPPPTLGEVIAALPELYMSYWAKFGQAQAWMSTPTYFLLTALVGVSVAGFLIFLAGSFRKRFRINALAAQQSVVLALVVVLLLGGTIQWLLSLFSARSTFTGRLMYPAHIATAILITGGLYLLSRHTSISRRTLQLGTVGLTAALGLITGPVANYAIYAAPAILAQSQLPKLKGGPIDFDHTMRFLGYSQTSPVIRPGEFHTTTVCWEVLRTPERSGAFTLKFFDGSNRTVGERTSLAGMGRFPSVLWKARDIFCDEVDIAVDRSLPPAQTFDVVVAMLDPLTTQVNWQATNADKIPVAVPIIGQVASPAGDMSGTINTDLQTSSIAFPGFADLKGFAFSETPVPGKPVRLTLLWNVTGRADQDLAQFVHLIGPQTAKVLYDGTPRAGRYPTWAWSPGEKIVDELQITLPEDLPPGDYTLKVGFYRRDNGERLAVKENGHDVDDRNGTLISFTLAD